MAGRGRDHRGQGRSLGEAQEDTGTHLWPWGRDGPGAPGSVPPAAVTVGCTHMGGDLLQLPQRHLVVHGADISPEVIVLRHCDLEVEVSEEDQPCLTVPSPQSAAVPLLTLASRCSSCRISCAFCSTASAPNRLSRRSMNTRYAARICTERGHFQGGGQCQALVHPSWSRRPSPLSHPTTPHLLTLLILS